MQANTFALTAVVLISASRGTSRLSAPSPSVSTHACTESKTFLSIILCQNDKSNVHFPFSFAGLKHGTPGSRVSFLAALKDDFLTHQRARVF